MAEVVLLGTSWALPTSTQENTYMALAGQHHIVLVDSAGSPYSRLLQAKLDPGKVDALILTHAHPDHMYGAPSLVMSLWLAGRRSAFDVYGPVDTCELLAASLAHYRSEHWPDMFEIRYHAVPIESGAFLFENLDFHVTAGPMNHMVPTLGLRVINRLSGRVLAYSADTEPAPEIVRLAQGATLLIHEASGARLGHSSAAQAGKVASEAGVARLILVHYGADVIPPAAVEAEARKTYAGETSAAQDFDRYEW